MYLQIALCIVGMSLYFNAGKLEARGGEKDRSILWASLSLLASLFAFNAGAGWFFWLVAQAVLFFGIALVRVMLIGNRQRIPVGMASASSCSGRG